MILRKSTLLLLLLTPANGYFASVNNAHVESLLTTSGSEADTAPETVDAQSNFQHSQSLWSTLEEALTSQSHLGYSVPHIMELFNSWIEVFAKEYGTTEEKGKRMLVWLENHVMIERFNADKAKTFTIGHNEFSDLTHEEFRRRMGLGEFTPDLIMSKGQTFNFMEFDDDETANERQQQSGLRGQATATERKLVDYDATKDEIDWHAIGLMGPIRNQGKCGACWAFSAVGAIESSMAIDKYHSMTPIQQGALKEKLSVQGANLGSDLGLVIPLSEQNLIDCDTVNEKGCDGGLMITAFEEEEVKKGICPESDYPYLEMQGTCSTDLCTPVPGSIVTDKVDVMPRKTKALKEALKQKPVTAAMVANDPMFQFYKTGIYSAKGCGRVTKQPDDEDCNILYEGQDVCFPDVNHGVLVVGFGTDDTVGGDVKDYFKVKNSWGNTWGEGGYFRLARWDADKIDPMENWGECAIMSLLSFPIVG